VEREAAAASFRNLGFESAVIDYPPYFQQPASDALPYWNNDNWRPGYVGYDTKALDSACISVHDSLSNYIKPLAGNYSVVLQDGSGDGGGGPVTSAYISQSGDIRATTRSLMFKCDITEYISELQVSLNGTVVPFELYSVGTTVNPGYGPVNTYACDISAFAGDTDVTLKFEKLVHDPLNPGSHGIVDLDGIQFSSTVVPEPSTLALLTIAAVVALAPIVRRRVARQRAAT
jgi:hypothetical protein